jgi:hypothetical protein
MKERSICTRTHKGKERKREGEKNNDGGDENKI